MRALLDAWPFWAVLSAVFAALTAIFGKLGVADIPADLATLLRTFVVIAFLAAIVAATGQWRPLGEVPARSWIFLTLSGLGTGASWLSYYRALKLGPASHVAPVDKLSVVLVAVFGVAFLGETLSARAAAGVALIAAGAVLMVLAP
jgi:transporter family protein